MSLTIIFREVTDVLKETVHCSLKIPLNRITQFHILMRYSVCLLESTKHKCFKR